MENNWIPALNTRAFCPKYYCDICKDLLLFVSNNGGCEEVTGGQTNA